LDRLAPALQAAQQSTVKKTRAERGIRVAIAADETARSDTLRMER
jgi:hypothetical protein